MKVDVTEWLQNYLFYFYYVHFSDSEKLASLMTLWVKNLPAMQETWV